MGGTTQLGEREEKFSCPGGEVSSLLYYKNFDARDLPEVILSASNHASLYSTACRSVSRACRTTMFAEGYIAQELTVVIVRALAEFSLLGALFLVTRRGMSAAS